MKPRLLVACDFDGTVTRQDTLVQILDRYGSADWRQIQAEVVSGQITIREGLSREMGSVRAGSDELQQLLTDEVELDPSFPDFFVRMRQAGIPVVLLSGGFDLCVEIVMKSSGLWPVPYLANRLQRSNGSWAVEFPFPSVRCQACGHCKGDAIRSWSRQGYTTVFVGNGVTDRCATEVATLSFAKDELAEWCRREGIPAVPYESFGQVEAELKRREWV